MRRWRSASLCHSLLNSITRGQHNRNMLVVLRYHDSKRCYQVERTDSCGFGTALGGGRRRGKKAD
jgi:hypothetical protein